MILNIEMDLMETIYSTKYKGGQTQQKHPVQLQ